MYARTLRIMNIRATWVFGLLGVAAVVALALHHELGRQTVAALPSAPLATPPGITLQVLAQRRAAEPGGPVQIIYADANGQALYTYAHDSPGRSHCDPDCTRRWPPALVPRGAAASGEWVPLRRNDGLLQWSHRGAPLYRSARDTAVGETHGDGLEDGAWHLARFLPGAGVVLPDGLAVREVSDAAGAAIVDAAGLTLYVYSGAASDGSVGCDASEDCARRWIPLQAPAIAPAIGDFSPTAREDGITQWSYRGRLLFRFDGDLKPGDARGVGFDPRFHVAHILRYFMPATAAVRTTTELGAILTTANGVTLYERDMGSPDEGRGSRAEHSVPSVGRQLGTSSCDVRCERTWHPFLAPSEATASGYWTVAKRADGKHQWVYKGFALYTYAADEPGELRGDEQYQLEQVSNSVSTSPFNTITYVRPEVAGGDAAGVGLTTMFWHAVVP
jgi:predicted lipoprotein with Yx(FWY)xxD motif